MEKKVRDKGRLPKILDFFFDDHIKTDTAMNRLFAVVLLIGKILLCLCGAAILFLFILGFFGVYPLGSERAPCPEGDRECEYERYKQDEWESHIHNQRRP